LATNDDPALEAKWVFKEYKSLLAVDKASKTTALVPKPALCALPREPATYAVAP
jgi:hypothetical protein